jgi:hypothetical protein
VLVDFPSNRVRLRNVASFVRNWVGSTDLQSLVMTSVSSLTQTERPKQGQTTETDGKGKNCKYSKRIFFSVADTSAQDFSRVQSSNLSQVSSMKKSPACESEGRGPFL